VTPAEFQSAKEPQVAVENDGRVYVAFGMRNAVYLSISNDAGKSYGNPIKIAEVGSLALGMRRGPRIALSHRTIVISAIGGVQGRGRDENLLSWRSSDIGKTWSGPARVNDVEASAREGLHAMAAGPDGTIVCAWLDLRSKGTKLYVSTSKDAGASWSENRLAYESPSGTICECCHPSLAFDAKGKLYAMFRNSVEGNRDMYLISSIDGGKSFGGAQKLGAGSWQLKACPMDGGMLAVDAQGEVVTFWRRADRMFLCNSGSSEIEIANGEQGWVAGVHRVWQNGGKVWGVSLTSAPFVLAEKGNDPVIASSPDGKRVIAAWTESGIVAAVVKPASSVR